MDDLTDRIARLSPEKWRLLESRLRKKITASADQTIPRRVKCEAIPLSFAQQRLWFLDQFEPGSTFYNISSAKRLKGTLNLEALQKTLDTIVARHEVLRTTFAAVDGVPEQVIAENRSLELEVRDLSTCSASDREAEVQRLLKEETGRPFNLSSDLMLRASLLKLEEQENILLLAMHHIASDGWSMRVLFRELTTLYEAFSTGKPSSLAELSIQYADYAIWQRQWLQGEVLGNQLSYWKKQLSGIPVLQLPTDRPRPPVQTYRGVQESLVLSRDLSNELKLLSRKERVTLFMMLLAAFQGLLHRYTGQEDIGVGSPIANRTRHEIQGLIGFFVNMLVLRTDLSGSPTFRELIGRVRKVALGAYEHQDLPFEKLVELLNPERNLSHAPLFQVMFAFENVSKSTLELPGLALSSVEVNRGTAMFDLILTVTEAADSLTVSLEYSTDLFEATTISRMLGHFQILLQGIAANPDQRLSDLPILTEAERHQLLVEWNDTRRDHPKDNCIHEFFETQVTRTPDHIAVICEDRQIAYRELNGRANQLARHLKKLGVGPEIKVGLCVERSLEMVVGLLGILKAGGAYVPLTPEYPQDRLAFMLKDSQAPVLLTQRRLVERLSGHNVQSVCLDTEWDAIAEESRENLVSEATGDNSAFVVYTSGSTGAPKGVIVSHGNLVNAYLAWEQAYSLRVVGSCHLQMANFSFDVFSGDLVRALCSGAKLFLWPHELLFVPEKLYEFMRREGVDCAEFVPVVLRNLLQYLRDTGQNLHFMRLLAVGSDAWHMQEHREVRLLCGPETRLIHSYGVTEATVDSSYFDTIDEVDLAAGRLVPIGRPFTNTEIYILDRSLQPVPIGVPGELYIGGAGLARGYFNRPELTAEKFIPNPFSVKPGERLYKTGDSARYMPDGNVEFLGRVDYQVKIRGFRIEPGEIEGVLSQHPAVRETTVLAREDVPGEKRLVAYVVASGVHSPTTSELRAFLQQKLPGYMIPSAFVLLESLPLTPNGKIDRRALSIPSQDRPDNGSDYVAPADPVECQLVQIWEELLSVRPIGVRDDFFELGGHSLLAVQLVHRIEQVYGKKLPLATLFAGATIQQVGKAIVNNHMAECQSPLVQLQSGGSKPPFFFLHGDFLGGGVYTHNLARGLGKDQPFYVLNPHEVDGKPMPATIEAMALSYIGMIQAVQPHGPYFLGGYCNGGVVAYEMARQLTQQKEKVELVALVAAPVKNTPQMRLLQHFISYIAYFCRFEAEEKMTLFLQSRDLYLYYSDRIEDVAQWPLNQRLAWAFRQSKRAVRQAPRLFTAAISRLTLNGRTADSEEFFEREDLLRSTGRAMKSYIPRRYAGRVVLFQPSEENPDGAEDPTMGWSRVASAIEVQMVPGGHISCVSTHVKTLAALIRASLDAI